MKSERDSMMEIYLELAQSFIALLQNLLSDTPDPEVDTRESARFRERCANLLRPEEFPSMQNDSFRHLGAGALDVLNNKKAQISVVGRELTDEEQQLLVLIPEAEALFQKVFARFAFNMPQEKSVRSPENFTPTCTPDGKVITLIWEGLECNSSSADALSSSRCQSRVVIPIACGSEEQVDAFGVTLKGSFKTTGQGRASILVEINGYALVKEFAYGTLDESQVGHEFTWQFFVPVARMPKSQSQLYYFDVKTLDGLFALSTYRQKANEIASLWLDSADIVVVQGMRQKEEQEAGE
jgi:hypothetical protein